MLNQHDIEILRPLLQQYAEIAALPVQDATRKLWLENNSRTGGRPMVLVDQICWDEMDVDGSLRLECQDPYWRDVECDLRRKLYLWKHMPVDKVYNPYLSLPKPIIDTGWGLEIHDETIVQGERSEISSHDYHNVLEEEEDIEKLHFPDEEKYRQIRQEADVLCQGILPYHMEGQVMHLGLWDWISQWMGVENCYIELIDRPEFLHAIMEKLTQGVLHQIECVNKIGAYDITSNITHCSHIFSHDLPGENADLEFGTTQQGWAFGLAQLFTAASPDVTAEFEIPYMNRIFPHFGAIYYGCCERLDDRLDVIDKLVKIRKISCSPWSHRDHFAEVMPDRCVMSAKPNPAFLAGDSFDEDIVRKDLRHTIDAARRYNRHLELLQKDISTVRHDPQRLWRWAEIAMEEVQR